MKTTKEIVEHLRNGLGSWLLLSRDIERCNSHELLCLAAASEIERLEKEVAELREEIIDRKAALAVERSNVELLSHKIDELRAKLDEAYERAAQVCDDLYESFIHAHRFKFPEGCLPAENGCSTCADAIRALKEKP